MKERKSAVPRRVRISKKQMKKGMMRLNWSYDITYNNTNEAILLHKTTLLSLDITK